MVLKYHSWLFCLKPSIQLRLSFCSPVFSVFAARFPLFVALLGCFQNVTELCDFLVYP